MLKNILVKKILWFSLLGLQIIFYIGFFILTDTLSKIILYYFVVTNSYSISVILLTKKSDFYRQNVRTKTQLILLYVFTFFVSFAIAAILGLIINFHILSLIFFILTLLFTLNYVNLQEEEYIN